MCTRRTTPRRGRQGESESERANWYAHLLIATRRIEGERFSAKKARASAAGVGNRPRSRDHSCHL